MAVRTSFRSSTTPTEEIGAALGESTLDELCGVGGAGAGGHVNEDRAVRRHGQRGVEDGACGSRLGLHVRMPAALGKSPPCNHQEQLGETRVRVLVVNKERPPRVGVERHPERLGVPKNSSILSLASTLA